MGTSFQLSFHLIPAKSDIGVGREPEESDLAKFKAIAARHGQIDTQFRIDETVRGFMNAGKFDWHPMARDIAMGIPAGLALVVVSVSDYGDAFQEYFLTGYGFAYKASLTVANFDNSILRRAIKQKAQKEKEDQKIRERAERKLAKLSEEERRILGIRI